VALLRDFILDVSGAWRLALPRDHDARYSSSYAVACRNRGRLMRGQVAGEATGKPRFRRSFAPPAPALPAKPQARSGHMTAILALRVVRPLDL
jgi:hypothetical protein